jgi:hypothetical protein
MHHSTTTSTANGIGRALLLLLAINLINYIDRYILAAVEPLIAEHFFASTDENTMAKTGSLAFAFLASYMLLAPCLGAGGSFLAMDDHSRRRGALELCQWRWIERWHPAPDTRFVGVGGGGPAAPTIISDLSGGTVADARLHMAMPGGALGYAFGESPTQCKTRALGINTSQSGDTDRL